MATIATLGSLYFSDIVGYPPCNLCWYQRIAFFPLVLIIPIGIWKADKHLPLYIFALAGAGWLIAFFHNLSYYEIIPGDSVFCVANGLCNARYIDWLGFIGIPLLSLIGLTAILIFAYVAWNTNQEQ